MSGLRAKILQTFRNIKSDAVPEASRPNPINQEQEDDAENKSETSAFESSKQNENNKKPFFFRAQKKKQPNHYGKFTSESITNTQASGNVINIVNSKDVHWGNEYVYHLGSPKINSNNREEKSDDETIEINESIKDIMENTDVPEHVYIDYVSKNLGKRWHGFFKTLGYTKGRIETVEMDEAKNGISEARYQLLLDWVRNDDIGTLGRLSTLLWEHGEKRIVHDLANMYKMK